MINDLILFILLFFLIHTESVLNTAVRQPMQKLNTLSSFAVVLLKKCIYNSINKVINKVDFIRLVRLFRDNNDKINKYSCKLEKREKVRGDLIYFLFKKQPTRARHNVSSIIRS